VSAAFWIGTWLVRPDLNTLSSDHTSVRLEPKVMQVLVCLASQPGTPFSKQEIMKTVWPSTFVCDDVLTRAVSELRRALQDDSRFPRFIETIPKRGYRLIVPVQWAEGENRALQDEGKKPTSTRRGLHMFRVVIAMVAVLIPAILLLIRSGIRTSVRGGPVVSHIHSVAVLPFKNLTDNPEQKYLADGLTEELITDLSQIQSLRVISKSSSDVYLDTNKTLPQIATELGVDGIVEGRVGRSGDRIRVSARLVQAAPEKQVFADSFETGMQDLVTFQRRLTRKLTTAVAARITPEENQRLAHPQPVNPEAYSDYLMGEYYLWNQPSPEGRREAVRYLERAVAKDPNYAPSHASLSLAYFHLTPDVRNSKPNVFFERSRAAAFRAAELDDSLPDAHRMIGILDYVSWDVAGAGKEFRRAVELRPGDARNLYMDALYLDIERRYEDAISEARRAALLDPFNIAVQSGLAKAYLYAARYDESIAQFSRILEKEPNALEIRAWLGYSYGRKGDFSRALGELGKAQADRLEAPRCVSLMGYFLAKQGNLAKASESLQELRRMARDPSFDVSPLDFATLYAGMGNADQSIGWLRRGYLEHAQGILEIEILPELASLRSDPRFQELVKHLGAK
jgi:TolB-like protein/DNA-binding winged helix-turn-helix (wHTH) protein/tetratricopeptide (TPR) repeat protein